MDINDTREQILMKLDYLLEKDYLREMDIEYIKSSIVTDLRKIKKDAFFSTLIERLQNIQYLYKNGIYNNLEFKQSKDIWIDSLKLYKEITVKSEDIFLELIPFIQKKTVDNNEIEKIKYIVSGKYFEEIERTLAEENRKNKEEKIRKIKKLTSEIRIAFNSKKNKVSEISNEDKNICGCGNKINKKVKFCRNCGKQHIWE